MKKLMALALALVMCLSCLGATAETVTVNASLSIDEEAILPMLQQKVGEIPNEQIAGLYQTIFTNALTLVDNLGGRVVFSEEGAQAELTLQDQAVVTLLGARTEEGNVMVCDLLPSYAILVPDDMLAQLSDGEETQETQGMQEMLSGLDPQAITEAIAGPLQTFAEGIQAKMGVPEFCQANFHGGVFNVKVPANITSREVITMVLELVQGVTRNEALAPLLAQVAGDFDPSQIDQMLENFSQLPDEQLPELEMNYYLNSENSEDKYVTVQAASQDQLLAIANGTVEGVTYCDIWTGENIYNSVEDLEAAAADGSGKASVINIIVVQNAEEGEAPEIVVSVMATSNGQFGGVEVVAAQMENGFSACVQLYYMNDEAPLAQLDLVAAMGGEIAPLPSLEGKTVISVADLTEENGQAISEALTSDVQTYGLNNLLATAAGIMPNEVVAIMTAIQGLQSLAMGQPATVEGVNP